MQNDPLLPAKPHMIGVQCFDVPLAESASVLLVHLRDIGHILTPEDARRPARSRRLGPRSREGRSGPDRRVGGGARRTTRELDAALTYGAGALKGGFDLVLEGEFGAGVAVSSDVQLLDGRTPTRRC